MLKIATAMMTFAIPPPRIATMPIASRMPGNANSTSQSRMIDAVRPAFVVAGGEPEQRADHRADRDRDEARGERDPRAHEDPAEDVAPERVDAEPVLPRRRRVELVVVEVSSRRRKGTIHGARTATTTSASTKTPATSATRCFLNLRQNSDHGVRTASGAAMAGSIGDGVVHDR